MTTVHANFSRTLLTLSLVLLVVACSGDEPPLEPAVGISAMPEQRGAGITDRLDSELKQIDERVDGWDTEALNREGGKRLKKLGELLHGHASPDSDAVTELITTEFTCTPLRPSKLSQVFLNGGLQVLRGVVDDERLVGAAGLVKALQGLAGAYPPGADIHVKNKIIRVETGEHDRFTTDILFQAWASGLPASVQQDCDWTVVWEWPDPKSAPRIRSIEVTRYDENHAPRELFSDCTEAVIGDTQAWKEQFLRGTDDWCTRIDIAAGMNQYSHNGVAIGDIDGDGLEDVYVCQGGGLPNRLFKHQRDGTAIEVAAAAGVDWLDESTSALIVDMDNDGRQDLLVAVERAVLVMRGDGAGKFELKTAVPLQGGYSMAAADYDGDGLLDVYVCRYNTAATSIGLPSPYHDANNGPPNVMLRNSGDFKLVEVTQALGLDENNRRFSFAAGWADYDEDGDLDLYVANDFGRNNLYRNDAGHFRDVAAEAGVEDISAGMGVSWGDYDGDGHLDLYVSNMFSSAGQRVAYQRRFKPTTDAKTRAEFQHHAHGNSLFRNKGDGTFEDVTAPSRTAMGRWAWGAQFCDIDNDGREDIYVTNGFVTNSDPEDL